ncbi:MAG: 2-hydroxyacid dehydrogenase [Methylotenera sp.]|uniref:2-hydroxyacid dehydrogenase n=1 Tax=Methylotenera sp. TaxID=2051956 RepID=UPI002726431E|nr:2-hydroxyacid dehydrogenase [Methylotenera sp.]MDO9149772.1 2-hydroxyacid dehydrogenase [Methylotenera sp.]
MRVAVFSTKSYDKTYLDSANSGQHQLVYLEPRLDSTTAFAAEGAQAVCVFVNDVLDAEVIAILAKQRVQLITLRCAGFNHVDLEAAKRHGITVARVPEYSPHSVAEHAVALMLTLNRKIHRASARVREANFSLDGLLGFDMYGKTVGVVGTGKIGQCVAKIMVGFGCKVLAYDPYPNQQCIEVGASYVALEELLSSSDIVSLHCPLTPETHHLIDEKAIKQMRAGVMLINISRGAVIDTRAIIRGLKSGVIGSLGLDVYEEEENLFFRDLSSTVIHDDVFARLLTFPNVVITGHQAFFTDEALTEIASTTIANISAYELSGNVVHPVSVERLV